MYLPDGYYAMSPTAGDLESVAHLCDLASGAVIGLPAFETANVLLTDPTVRTLPGRDVFPRWSLSAGVYTGGYPGGGKPRPYL